MKSIIKLLVFLLLIGWLFHISCKKEYSCEGCRDTNKPPIANAGPDQTILLPQDSTMLDGSASSDPDGTISNFQWRKISGPSSFNITNSSVTQTRITNLVQGVYQFELKVTDAGGLFSKDTVQIAVNDPAINHPPIACAGVDQVITLPTNTGNLDGSCSIDPDNNITSYAWTKISGPSSFNITNADVVQTQVTNLVQGVYEFELKVTDAGGLFSKDTMKVTVEIMITGCNENRPIINAQLIPIGSLSQQRGFVSVVSAGNKIFFAGGSIWPSAPYASSRVDIYDISTQTWSTAELSTPRWEIATVAAGSKVFFAGGGYYDDADNGTSVNTIDIFDINTNQWTTASLTGRRKNVAAATVGNKVFFAGGATDDFLDSISNKVDIYDLTTNTWSIAVMSESKSALTAVAANNKVYFAGGISGWRPLPNSNFDYIASNRIDVYDNATNSWSISALNEGKYFFAGIAVGDNIYWAGGFTDAPANPNSCKVEIANLNTKNSSTQYLSRARTFFVDGSQNAVVKDGNIIFFTGERYYSAQNNKNKFDIYNISSNSWLLGVLPQNLQVASIISLNNIIYVTDGYQVWKLDF